MDYISKQLAPYLMVLASHQRILSLAQYLASQVLRTLASEFLFIINYHDLLQCKLPNTPSFLVFS